MKKLFDSVPNITGENVELKKLTIEDLKDIKEMLLCKDIYQYVPPFIPELRYEDDIKYLINNVCDKLFKKKIEILLGIHAKNYNNKLCGLFELYHYISNEKKVSIG